MNDLLTRRVAKVLPTPEELAKRAEQGPLRVYLGIDPTGGQLHIGHAIGIKKLMEFAEAGHEAILLFGTGTVLVGDPSQRDHARKRVDQEEIEANIQTWKDQVAPIVDFGKVTIKQNGDWITKMSLSDIIGVASNISATQLFKRESFTRRIKAGDTVWYHETMYPILQGYDSVVMDVDLEIGGTDQEFNMLMGRELQKKMNNREKFVITVPMIMGTDGQQMSKTSGNCVWLQDPPQEMFGKLMSVGDEQIIPYLELCTDLTIDALNDWKRQLEEKRSNPKDAKEHMAQEVTAIWHGRDAAVQARSQFSAQFSKGERPEDILTVDGGSRIDDVIFRANLVESKSEARRLVEQGAVKINDEKIEGLEVNLNSGDVIQVGKRRYIKIK
ncbi:MAG: tyrosine--tRNA ligase [Candidatus Saccharimonadales bacterium]|nr:tyrosine--tRNA ligase [Candidatus Saccharimonadales bacterium]